MGINLFMSTGISKEAFSFVFFCLPYSLSSKRAKTPDSWCSEKLCFFVEKCENLNSSLHVCKHRPQLIVSLGDELFVGLTLQSNEKKKCDKCSEGAASRCVEDF